MAHASATDDRDTALLGRLILSERYTEVIIQSKVIKEFKMPEA